jgi:hypothetical protein
LVSVLHPAPQTLIAAEDGLKKWPLRLENTAPYQHFDAQEDQREPAMMTNDGKYLSKTSLDTLSAISSYRRQFRSGRVWLVGDRRISIATIAGLERRAFVKEIARNGTPALILTDAGKRLVSGAAMHREGLRNSAGT